MYEEYMVKAQRRKANKFRNDLKIYDEAKRKYEAGEINIEELERIARELDL